MSEISQMSEMSDREMGEFLEIMDLCDELTCLLYKIRQSPRFSDYHKKEFEDLPLTLNNLASLLEKTCKSHCPPQDQSVPIPNHFNVARKVWATIKWFEDNKSRNSKP
jgi:hypothetical protein